jgi:hypothetical protein
VEGQLTATITSTQSIEVQPQEKLLSEKTDKFTQELDELVN